MLFAKRNSNVPTYAYEFLFAKSDSIFGSLPACRQFCLHAEAAAMPPFVLLFRLWDNRMLSVTFCVFCDSMDNKERSDAVQKCEEFIITPKAMLLDKRLGKPCLREFYGVLEQLTHRDGHCFASDRYLAGYLGCGKRTISRWINQLKEYGYIRVKYIKSPDGRNTEKRIISLTSDISPQMAKGYRHKWRGGIATNGGENNKRIIIKDDIREDDYALLIRLPKFMGKLSERDMPVYCRCQREEDARKEAEEEEAKRKFNLKLQTHRNIRDSLMDERGREAVFDKLEVNSENRKYICAAKRYCDEWAENYKNNHGLLFYGGPGRGKTTLACCIANRLLSEGVAVKAVGINSLIQRAKSSYGDGGYDEAEIKAMVKEAELLILDDLGTEYKTEWSTSFIYDIIDARYRSNRPMIITTNLTLPQLRAHLTDRNDIARTFDRLTEILTPVEFDLGNYRIQKAAQLRSEYSFV